MKFASLQFGSMMILHCTYLVPRRLSLDENVRAKEGGKETTTVCTLSMVPCGSPPVARIYLACSRLSDSGEDAKLKGTRNVGGPFYFRVRAFSGPDYLGACNRLASTLRKTTRTRLRRRRALYATPLKKPGPLFLVIYKVTLKFIY